MGVEDRDWMRRQDRRGARVRPVKGLRVTDGNAVRWKRVGRGPAAPSEKALARTARRERGLVVEDAPRQPQERP